MSFGFSLDSIRSAVSDAADEVRTSLTEKANEAIDTAKKTADSVAQSLKDCTNCAGAKEKSRTGNLETTNEDDSFYKAAQDKTQKADAAKEPSSNTDTTKAEQSKSADKPNQSERSQPQRTERNTTERQQPKSEQASTFTQTKPNQDSALIEQRQPQWQTFARFQDAPPKFFQNDPSLAKQNTTANTQQNPNAAKSDTPQNPKYNFTAARPQNSDRTASTRDQSNRVQTQAKAPQQSETQKSQQTQSQNLAQSKAKPHNTPESNTPKNSTGQAVKTPPNKGLPGESKLAQAFSNKSETPFANTKTNSPETKNTSSASRPESMGAKTSHSVPTAQATMAKLGLAAIPAQLGQFAISQFQKVVGRITSMSAPISKSIADGQQKVSRFITATLESTGKTLGLFAEKAVAQLVKFGQSIQKAVSYMATKATQMLLPIYNAAMKVITKLTNTLNSLSEKVSSMMNKALIWITSGMQKFELLAEKTARAVTNWWSRMIKGLSPSTLEQDEEAATENPVGYWARLKRKMRQKLRRKTRSRFDHDEEEEISGLIYEDLRQAS